jgi:hypothetical protein
MMLQMKITMVSGSDRSSIGVAAPDRLTPVKRMLPAVLILAARC